METFVEINNDGKEKDDSFEAYLDKETEHFLSIACYGETQEEAVTNLKNRVEEFITQLQAIDWSAVRQRKMHY